MTFSQHITLMMVWSNIGHCMAIQFERTYMTVDMRSVTVSECLLDCSHFSVISYKKLTRLDISNISPPTCNLVGFLHKMVE